MSGKPTKPSVGSKYNHLEILSIVGKNERGETLVECKCDCGNVCVKRYCRITSGNVKSCGCLRIQQAKEKAERNKLEYGRASKNAIYYRYQENAKRRNIEFSLDFDTFIQFCSDVCHYCAAEPSNKENHKSYNGLFVHNGIDRVDNNKGYLVDNCVTCCETCNFGKRNMTQSEFLGWIERVYHHQRR